jgi:hypothetical protein
MLVAPVSTAAAQPVYDNKLWSSMNGEADLTDSARVSVSEELRTGGESGFDQARTEIDVGIRPSAYLGLAALYVLMLRDGDPRLGTADETRHRFAGSATVRYEIGRVSLSNRVRVQYTTYELEDDHVHVRDRIRAGYDVTKHVTPYAAFEAIYLLSPKQEYRESRIYLGVDWRVIKRLEVGAFYLRQAEANVQLPERNNIVGLELTYLVHKIKKK